jgi:hypothetical protein
MLEMEDGKTENYDYLNISSCFFWKMLVGGD